VKELAHTKSNSEPAHQTEEPTIACAKQKKKKKKNKKKKKKPTTHNGIITRLYWWLLGEYGDGDWLGEAWSCLLHSFSSESFVWPILKGEGRPLELVSTKLSFLSTLGGGGGGGVKAKGIDVAGRTYLGGRGSDYQSWGKGE